MARHSKKQGRVLPFPGDPGNTGAASKAKGSTAQSAAEEALPFAYSVVRSRRKSVSIHIREDATVEVRAPLSCTDYELAQILQSKRDWVTEHLALRRAQLESREASKLHYGSLVWYCGKQYPIYERAGKYAGFDAAGFYMPPGLTSEALREVMVSLYRQLAKRYLPARVGGFAVSMQLFPSAVKVTSARTRWGSCSQKHALNFSWRLMLAPEELIDYVIVHELAHIQELNHSPAFWQVVERELPDYRERRRALTDLANRLNQDIWMDD